MFFYSDECSKFPRLNLVSKMADGRTGVYKSSQEPHVLFEIHAAFWIQGLNIFHEEFLSLSLS